LTSLKIRSSYCFETTFDWSKEEQDKAGNYKDIEDFYLDKDFRIRRK